MIALQSRPCNLSVLIYRFINSLLIKTWFGIKLIEMRALNIYKKIILNTIYPWTKLIWTYYDLLQLITGALINLVSDFHRMVFVYNSSIEFTQFKGRSWPSKWVVSTSQLNTTWFDELITYFTVPWDNSNCLIVFDYKSNNIFLEFQVHVDFSKSSSTPKHNY